MIQVEPKTVSTETAYYEAVRHALNQKREKEACEKSYEQFVRSAWHVLEPSTPLEWNWHLTYLCDEAQSQMERIAEKRSREYHLCINVPPSSLKSMIFTRMANAWAWIKWPWMRFITTSYATSLSETHSLDTLTLIKHEWYQTYWHNRYHIDPKQEAKGFYRTSSMGERFISSTGASVTGMHGNIIIPDDLLNPKGGASAADLKSHRLYWTRTLPSRFCNNKIDMFWVVQQRLSPEDTTGLIIEFEGKKYKIICLPAEERDWISPPELRKFYTNGLLFPKRFSREFLEAEKKKMGPVAYAAQYLQRPSPEEGDMFKRKNWRFWVPAGVYLEPITINIGAETFTCTTVELPKAFDNSACTWDFAFKDKETNDDVCGEVWSVSGANCFLLAEDCGKKDYSKSCNAMITMKNDWPLTSKILIEDKANGSAIISAFKEMIPGITPIPANKGDSPKTKALVVSRKQEAGNVILPHPKLPGYGWVQNFIDEYADYTGAESDKNNRVAAGCQAIIYLTQGKPVFEHYDYKTYDIRIDWRELKPEMRLYASTWTEPDLTTSTILALWNQRIGRMAVFDELIVNTPDAEGIKLFLAIKMTRLSGGVITNLDRFIWYGNPAMFGRKVGTRGIRHSAIVDGIAESYTRSHINLLDNYSFEERGAITATDRMFARKSVMIDRRAPETARQPAAWCFQGKDPAPGHGCARALINLCSVVYEEIKAKPDDKRIPEYTPMREAITNELNKDSNADRLGQYIKQRPEIPIVGDTDTGLVKESDKWMV